MTDQGERTSKRHAVDWKHIDDGSKCPICYHGTLRGKSARFRIKKVGWFLEDTQSVIVMTFQCDTCRCLIEREAE